MITTFAELQETHPDYGKNQEEWKFLYDAYMGGKDWEAAGYLTRYVFESDADYYDRVAQTPYDNHCRSIVHLYNSFIYSTPPTRDLVDLAQDPAMIDFLEDADLEGRSFDQFMRQVDITSSVFGSAWVIVDKPAVVLNTAAEEQALGVRPYVALFSPLNVLDWKFERQINGRYELVYLKVLENQDQDEVIVKEFDREMITTYRGLKSKKDIEIISAVPNSLGKVPAVIAYNARSGSRGIGISEIQDVARVNRSIYDEHSEIVQIIRLSNHPSLVKTSGTQAAAGAGAIIQIEDNLDPGLKPYLLQPDAASLDGVRASIKDKVEAINRMAAVGSVRATETRTMSGVAIETEMRTLNAKLSEKADEMELAEEKILELWCEWQATVWQGTIKYPDSFNARDRKNDLNLLQQALTMVGENADLKMEIHRQVAEIVIEDPEKLAEVLESIDEYDALEDQAEAIRDDSTESDDQERLYPDGQPIPEDLPPAYQSSASDGVPEGQACGNCEHNVNQMCSLFNNAPIRESWWCLKWEPKASNE